MDSLFSMIIIIISFACWTSSYWDDEAELKRKEILLGKEVASQVLIGKNTTRNLTVLCLLLDVYVFSNLYYN